MPYRCFFTVICKTGTGGDHTLCLRPRGLLSAILQHCDSSLSLLIAYTVKTGKVMRETPSIIACAVYAVSPFPFDEYGTADLFKRKLGCILPVIIMRISRRCIMWVKRSRVANFICIWSGVAACHMGCSGVCGNRPQLCAKGG